MELSGSRPLQLEIGLDPGTALVDWPAEQVVEMLCLYHPDDPEGTKLEQEETLRRLALSARRNGLEFLLEIIGSKSGPIADDTIARAMSRFYDLGVRLDWWKLESMRSESAWRRICALIEERDPWCRGVVVLGFDTPGNELADSLAAAAQFPQVKGLAVGRTVFSDPARAWFRGEVDDANDY